MSDKTQKYLFIGRQHGLPQGRGADGEIKEDKIIVKGDVIELNEKQAKALEGKVVLADSDEAKIAKGQTSVVSLDQVDATAKAEIERLKAALAEAEKEKDKLKDTLKEYVDEVPPPAPSTGQGGK